MDTSRALDRAVNNESICFRDAAGALVQSSMKQILLVEFTTAVMKPTEFLWVMLRAG